MLIELRDNVFVNIDRIDFIDYVGPLDADATYDCLIYMQNQKVPLQCNHKDLERIRMVMRQRMEPINV